MSPILKHPTCIFSPSQTPAHHIDSQPAFSARVTPGLSALALSCFLTSLSYLSPLYQAVMPAIPPESSYLDNQRPLFQGCCLTLCRASIRPPGQPFLCPAFFLLLTTHQGPTCSSHSAFLTLLHFPVRWADQVRYCKSWASPFLACLCNPFCCSCVLTGLPVPIQDGLLAVLHPPPEPSYHPFRICIR